MNHLPRLPVERALKVISGRWKPIILHHVLAGPLRLSEIERLMPSISQKVLIQQLREMETHGLVRREVFAQVPVRVEYAPTPLAETLRPVLKVLCAWGRHHAEAQGDAKVVASCSAGRAVLPSD